MAVALKVASLPVSAKANTHDLTALPKDLTDGVFVNVPRQVSNKHGHATFFLLGRFPGTQNILGRRVLDRQPASLEVVSIQLNRGSSIVSGTEIDNGSAGAASIIHER
jgi:hypothetical protein